MIITLFVLAALIFIACLTFNRYEANDGSIQGEPYLEKIGVFYNATCAKQACLDHMKHNKLFDNGEYIHVYIMHYSWFGTKYAGQYFYVKYPWHGKTGFVYSKNQDKKYGGAHEL